MKNRFQDSKKPHWQALGFAPKITRTPHLPLWFCRSLWALLPLCSQKPREDATPSTLLSAVFLRCSSVSLCLCGESLFPVSFRLRRVRERLLHRIFKSPPRRSQTVAHEE